MRIAAAWILAAAGVALIWHMAAEMKADEYGSVEKRLADRMEWWKRRKGE